MEHDPAHPFGAGCSAVSWRTLDGRQLWGRNFDYDRIAPDSRVTYVPRGTAYACCMDESGAAPPGARLHAAHAALGTGLLSPCPILYEGVNGAGLMGGQLYYRRFAHYPAAPRPGTLPLQPPLAVYHLLAQCASVQQVAHVLRHEVTLVAAPLFGAVPPLHWMFCDRTGESIVVEPDADGLHIYPADPPVMTNSPPYPWHRLHLLQFTGLRDLDRAPPRWGGSRLADCFSGTGAQGLPGDWSSPARFVRLSFLRQYAVPRADEMQGTARLFRLLQSAAFPLGAVRVAGPGQTSALDGDACGFDHTIYSAVLCAQSGRYCWTTYDDPRIRCADLAQLSGCTEPVRFALEDGPQPDGKTDGNSFP